MIEQKTTTKGREKTHEEKKIICRYYKNKYSIGETRKRK